MIPGDAGARGRLLRLVARPGPVAACHLALAEAAGEQESTREIDLNSLIGKGFLIEFEGRISCSACAASTRRSYGEGYCYGCFRRLARCDLCVVSPVRCHFAQGTCREPEWGQEHCMQPHVVYLANSSAPKVGITSAGGQLRRWFEQGASQGLVIAEASSRHLAGVLEDRLSRRISDRTDWRALLRGDAAPVDLHALAGALRPPDHELPAGVRWLDDQQVVGLAYPVQRYPRRLERLDLDTCGTVAGRLLGIKGQYLLFEHGVFNVRRHRAYHVRVAAFPEGRIVQWPDAQQLPHQAQMELFS